MLHSTSSIEDESNDDIPCPVRKRPINDSFSSSSSEGEEDPPAKKPRVKAPSVSIKKHAQKEPVTNNDDDISILISRFAKNVRATMCKKLCKYHNIKYNLTTDMGCKTFALLDDLMLNASSISESIKAIWFNNTDRFTICKFTCDSKHHKINLYKLLVLLCTLLTSDSKISLHDFGIKLSDIKTKTPKLSTSKTISDVWNSLNMNHLISTVFKKEDYQRCTCVSTLESHMKTNSPHFFGFISCDEHLLDIIFSNLECSLNKTITNDDIFLLTKDKFIEVGLSYVSNVDNYFELISKLVKCDNKWGKKISTDKFKSEKLKMEVTGTTEYPKYIYYVNNHLLSVDTIPEMFVNKHTILHKVKMLERCQPPTINTFNHHIICTNCASYGYISETKNTGPKRALRPKIDNHMYHYLKMIHNIIYYFPLIFDIRRHIMMMYNRLISKKIIQMSEFY